MTLTLATAHSADPSLALSFVVYGTPAPQGSKRHVGKGVLIDTNDVTLRTWREDVKLAALRAMAGRPDWQRDHRAILGTFAFTLARPKSHYRTGQYAGRLRRDAPTLHTTRPDLDKLLRSTWDALTTAGAYGDDCRVAQVWATKTYTAPGHDTALDRPGAVITLEGVRLP